MARATGMLLVPALAGLAVLGCRADPGGADPRLAMLGRCEAQSAAPERAERCLLDQGWDTTAARDRVAYLRHRLAAADTATGASRLSAARAAQHAGQPVVVVDSVVGIVLGNRHRPFEILLGVDSATAPLRLTVEWKRLSRFPVLKWRYRVLAATGTVAMPEDRATIVLDAEGQARLVPQEPPRDRP